MSRQNCVVVFVLATFALTPYSAQAVDPQPLQKLNLFKRWEVNGLKMTAQAGDGLSGMREYVTDRELPDVWNRLADLAGSKVRYKPGATGVDAVYAGDTSVQVQYHNSNDDPDFENDDDTRPTVRVATLNIITSHAAIVVNLSRARDEKKTFVNIVVTPLQSAD